MMGFLQLANDAYDVLGAAVDSVGLQALEGPAGSLELLHEFSDMPGITKYQALFDPCALADKSSRCLLLMLQAGND